MTRCFGKDEAGQVEVYQRRQAMQQTVNLRREATAKGRGRGGSEHFCPILCNHICNKKSPSPSPPFLPPSLPCLPRCLTLSVCASSANSIRCNGHISCKRTKHRKAPQSTAKQAREFHISRPERKRKETGRGNKQGAGKRERERGVQSRNLRTW